jgi:hypothetical protein
MTLVASPARKPAHPLLLLNGLNSFGSVGVPDPSNSFGWLDASKNGHARQHRPRATAAAEAADLDQFALARTYERALDLARG